MGLLRELQKDRNFLEQIVKDSDICKKHLQMARDFPLKEEHIDNLVEFGSRIRRASEIFSRYSPKDRPLQPYLADLYDHGVKQISFAFPGVNALEILLDNTIGTIFWWLTADFYEWAKKKFFGKDSEEKRNRLSIVSGAYKKIYHGLNLKGRRIKADKRILNHRGDAPERNMLLEKNADSPLDDIIYFARDNSYFYDVREFIFSDDAILKEVVKANKLKGRSFDESAYNCMCWVQDNIKYALDEDTSGYKEEWQFPTDTLQNGYGDCEDGANLMISLMRNCGILASRIRNNCGLVEASENGKKVYGGHSWTSYLRESDDEWVILDWCFLKSKKPIYLRSKMDSVREYSEIWFSFNDEHSWGGYALKVGKGHLPKKTFDFSSNVESRNTAKIEDCLINDADFIGIPRNSDYLEIAHILRGEYGGSHIDRLRMIQAKLGSLRPSEDYDDLNYIKRLKHYVENSVDDRLSLRFANGQNPGGALAGLIESFDKYIGTCVETAA